jgi:hypothetical protein
VKASAQSRKQRRRRLTLGAFELLGLLALAVALPAGVRSEGGRWSQPAILSGCSAPDAPAVVFPQDAPRHGTGPGAIVWGAGSRCRGGAGPRVATIAAGTDIPMSGPDLGPHAGRAYGLTGTVAAAAAPHGRILLAVGARTRGDAGDGLLLSEGLARGPFSTPIATGGAAAPLSLTSAYLGDVALLAPGPSRSPSAAGPMELRVHRYYATAAGSFQPAVKVAAAGPIEGLTVAMDYRSDALAVWERNGTIYARDMPGSGRVSRAVVRVASAAPGAHIAALLSDDNRATLAWSETRGQTTRVFAELSGTGVRFGAPRLLERLTDPDGASPPSGSPRLVRLLSESVMLAWSGAASGHWVVRAAAVDLNGVRSIETISAPGHDALLAALAPGPAGEAYALWSEPRTTRAGRLDSSDRALYAARGIDAYPGRTIFTAPEAIAAAGVSGCTGQAAIAVDPDSDRALAAWRTPGGTIDYSLRALGGA